MPWSVKDVESHKKGLTSTEKKEWVKVANSVLADCIKKGGTDKTCAPKAIRIANSKFMEENKDMNKSTIPVSAFSFTDMDSFAKIDKEGNVDILAYSGKPFKHWYWGNFAIDLTGAEFPQKFFPVLEQHDVVRKIGFSTKPSIEDNKLAIKNMTFLNTEEALAFQDNSKIGFPYQASIQGRPSIVENIDDGESVIINGHKLVGPGAIWRKWTYMETSVCVFGADPNTKSKALADENEEIAINFLNSSHVEEVDVIQNKEVKNEMFDIKKWKEENPETHTALVQEVEQVFKNKEDEMLVKLTAMSTELEEKSKKLGEYEIKLLTLEKAEILRQENELRIKAETIWNSCLSESQIPERLFNKVKAHVSYEKFLKEGVFDGTAFTEAVKNEILDWEKEGVSTLVLGKGFSQTEVDNVARLSQEDDEWVKDMRKMSGQTIN